MPKATLKFDLTDPDDKIDFIRASHAIDLCAALYDIYMKLPSIDDDIDHHKLTIEEFNSILERNNVNLHEWYQ